MINCIESYSQVLTTKLKLFVYRTIVILHIFPMILHFDISLKMILKFDNYFSLKFVFALPIMRNTTFLASIILICATINIFPLIMIGLKNTK